MSDEPAIQYRTEYSNGQITCRGTCVLSYWHETRRLVNPSSAETHHAEIGASA